ncbi:conserved hypothetical protein [Burkholderia pseudomallei S13]|nr:conserved hypothetical protein [Burkholderia pseudomallei S13]
MTQSSSAAAVKLPARHATRNVRMAANGGRADMARTLCHGHVKF